MSPSVAAGGEQFGHRPTELVPFAGGEGVEEPFELRADFGGEGGRLAPAGRGRRRLQGAPVADNGGASGETPTLEPIDEPGECGLLDAGALRKVTHPAGLSATMHSSFACAAVRSCRTAMRE